MKITRDDGRMGFGFDGFNRRGQSNRLLTPNEASHLLSDAAAMTSSSFRFGQALWNTLESAYPALADKFRGTEVDFYYAAQEQEVINIFISNFVERE